MGEFGDKVVRALREHGKYGLTLTELMSISGLSYSAVINAFDELEDSGKLQVKSDGLSRIYKLRE